ncbi:hypothetical protein T440DRAFT_487767 [Plenodomus tracheiphilus IPT5]|uniref:C6 finger domain-containing protein n=1 Tax=Plenodomus tracheiphilus IPT5 TaxID=1408161 RepID=A0A6A7BCV2_9PLEO|nr:hypothetical protein T440DRAFT_487767 [Plenodomus tracheiphilus IPT5]
MPQPQQHAQQPPPQTQQQQHHTPHQTPQSQHHGQQQHPHQHQHSNQHHDGSHSNQQRRFTAGAPSTPAHVPHPGSAASMAAPMGLSFPAAIQPMNPMLANWININTNTDNAFLQDPTYGFTEYGAALQQSPVEFNLNASAAMMTTMSMAPLSFMPTTLPFHMSDFHTDFAAMPPGPDFTAPTAANSVSTGGSPGEQWMEIRSLSSSDNGWVDVGVNHRSSYDFSDTSAIVFNPAQSLHIRTNSDSSTSNHSDVPRSANSIGSFEEIQYPLHSPQSETDNTLELVSSHYSHTHSDSCHHTHGLPMSDHDFANYISPNQSVSPPMARAEPIQIKQSSSSTASPTSSAVSSPPARRRKSPVGAKPAKTIVKKTPAHSTKKDVTGEKRVGRRRGPLRPDQRQQAHEIRKLRACLRCKFLKKTCDKGDPCAGCQPSHARLWQVPCTRIDIKDIAYFMKDWKADYERHVSLGFSIGNIKGFASQERMIYVTHGYGHYLPIMAREVYVRDEKCFGVDWHETLNGLHFEINTAKLSAGMEGISRAMLSDYLDRHIDGGFEQFVDEYFEGTFFVTELLKTAYRFYCREKLPVIRKALKLVLAYNLTLHVTMVEGIGEEDNTPGKVEDQQSKFCGKTVAPVMINFQVKCALADMWRDLQKDVLEELSSLYQSVYSGDKLKNWPTIFMLAAILLAVWELIQFDCNYRVPDVGAVNKFCSEMEGTPVGVIVGLFSAISQKLPVFTEWDTRKHHLLLNSNPAVCDAMTEVRAHVTKYETYLRSRSDCKFDRQDFDSLSNKFLSKLVIRAN